MASVNPLNKEILIKVVYYGPGLGGKTTTLQYIHRTANPEHRGKMVSLATPIDRTLYFDFLPVRLPKVGSYTLRLQLFTVPGQVHYNATRKLVLTGADGTVFVADSQPTRMDANLESLENLKDNLAEQKIDFDSHPVSFQYNKRDLKNVMDIDELDGALNPRGLPAIGTCALTGEGVYQGLEVITKAVLKDLKRREVLIHDERSTEERLENELSFGSEDSSITESVKKFSESSDKIPVPDMSSEKTATYRVVPGVVTDRETGAAPPVVIPIEHGKGLPRDARPTLEPPAPPEPEAERTPRPELQPQPQPEQEPAVASEATTTPPSAPPRPASAPPPPLADGARLSFAPLWPAGGEEEARLIESAIRGELWSEAIASIWRELQALLEDARAGLPGSSVESVLALLGLSGRRYLEVARLAREAADGAPIAGKSVLRAYLYLLEIVAAVHPER